MNQSGKSGGSRHRIAIGFTGPADLLHAREETGYHRGDQEGYFYKRREVEVEEQFDR